MENQDASGNRIPDNTEDAGEFERSPHLEGAWNFDSILSTYKLKKQRLKITQLEKVSFMKVNELKLTQVELFQFFHFMCDTANASDLFCMARLANM